MDATQDPGDAAAVPNRAQPPDTVEGLEVVDEAEIIETDRTGAQTAAELSVAIHHREGPLPSPADLRAYFDISDYVGTTIVDMAKNAAGHRHKMERRSFWVILTVILCVTLVMLAVVGAAAWVAAEVSVVGGVIVLLASPTAVLWALLARLVRRARRQRSATGNRPPADEEAQEGS